MSIQRKMTTVHYMDVYTTVGINAIITWVQPCFIKGKREVMCTYLMKGE